MSFVVSTTKIGPYSLVIIGAEGERRRGETTVVYFTSMPRRPLELDRD
jgi:hypothetical protein